MIHRIPPPGDEFDHYMIADRFIGSIDAATSAVELRRAWNEHGGPLTVALDYVDAGVVDEVTDAAVARLGQLGLDMDSGDERVDSLAQSLLHAAGNDGENTSDEPASFYPQRLFVASYTRLLSAMEPDADGIELLPAQRLRRTTVSKYLAAQAMARIVAADTGTTVPRVHQHRHKRVITTPESPFWGCEISIATPAPTAHGPLRNRTTMEVVMPTGQCTSASVRSLRQHDYLRRPEWSDLLQVGYTPPTARVQLLEPGRRRYNDNVDTPDGFVAGLLHAIAAEEL